MAAAAAHLIHSFEFIWYLTSRVPHKLKYTIFECNKSKKRIFISIGFSLQLFKNSQYPSYNETFSFWLSKRRVRRSLWFHLYHSGNANTLLGEAELQIGDISRPITTWLSLSDSKHHKSIWGDLMFSISYLPTAERLTVVVVKARNLKLPVNDTQASTVNNSSLQNIFVKVYID